MPGRQPNAKLQAAKQQAPKARGEPVTWFESKSNSKVMEDFGFRLSGGGAHQSKTMMLNDIQALLATRSRTPHDLQQAVVIDNVLGKSTSSSRTLTYRHLANLYGLKQQPTLTRLLLALWQPYPASRALSALLVALARDPLLRDTAHVVIDGSVGAALQRPLFEAALAAKHPRRFSDSMLRSLAQNCASTWTQSGHLLGPMRKKRQRITATPEVVALAALLASVAGFGGPAMLSSPWMRVLDLSPEQALDLLRRAESLGLARVRSAGDVTEISTRKQIAATLRMPELELAR